MKPDFSYHISKSHYDIPENYQHHKLKIVEWLKPERAYIEQGEPLIILGYETSYGNNETLTHYAPSAGYLNKMVRHVLNTLSENDLVYILHENDRQRISLKFQNVTDIILDEFSGQKEIKWQRVGAMDGYQQAVTSYTADGKTSLLLTFNYIAGKDHLVFQHYPNEIKLIEGDTISLLLDNGQVLEFIVQLKPHKVSHRFINGLFETCIPVLQSELELLQTTFVIKWKVTLKNENRSVFGGQKGSYQYESHQSLKEVIQKLAGDYIATVLREIPDYVPLAFRETNSQVNMEGECFVYLMHDTVNDFYKIGISNQPEWREKTLQSEKPTIELIAAKKFIRRKLAVAFERALHDTYATQRIRGEWFNLSQTDILELAQTLR